MEEVKSMEQPVVAMPLMGQKPKLLLHEAAEDSDQFIKHLAFSPDGTCLLAGHEPKQLTLYEFEGKNRINSALSFTEGEAVHDLKWYPFMDSSSPITCCFATASGSCPVHLWDAYTGKLRASYRPYNHVDEIASIYSICFSSRGDELLAGSERMVYVFDMTRPGRTYEQRRTAETKKAPTGQKGLISCIAMEHTTGVYACGSFNGSVYVYDHSTGDPLLQWEDLPAGVTHVQFTPDGRYLLAGFRKYSDIAVWDLRNSGELLYTLNRSAPTNQRIHFDISADSQMVFTGSEDRSLKAYSLLDGSLVWQLEQLEDAVNSVSIHPSQHCVAIGTGQRSFAVPCSDSESDSASESEPVARGSKRQRVVKRTPGISLWEFASKELGPGSTTMQNTSEIEVPPQDHQRAEQMPQGTNPADAGPAPAEGSSGTDARSNPAALAKQTDEVEPLIIGSLSYQL